MGEAGSDNSRPQTITLCERTTVVIDRTEVETWKPIPGWEGYYEASDLGRIRSVDRVIEGRWGPRVALGKVLTAHPLKIGGYLQVKLCRDARMKGEMVHVLVLSAFVSPRPDGLEACHGNGNVTDNRPANLRWDTRSANMLDKVRHGTHNHAGKTECPRGHAYTPENTYWQDSRRSCIECRRARSRGEYANAR